MREKSRSVNIHTLDRVYQKFSVNTKHVIQYNSLTGNETTMLKSLTAVPNSIRSRRNIIYYNRENSRPGLTDLTSFTLFFFFFDFFSTSSPTLFRLLMYTHTNTKNKMFFRGVFKTRCLSTFFFFFTPYHRPSPTGLPTHNVFKASWVLYIHIMF